LSESGFSGFKDKEDFKKRIEKRGLKHKDWIKKSCKS
jgi:hypothetical protein